MGIELLDIFLSSVGLFEGCRLLYCHAGLDIGDFDVGTVSSGNLCHFLFLGSPYSENNNFSVHPTSYSLLHSPDSIDHKLGAES